MGVRLGRLWPTVALGVVLTLGACGRHDSAIAEAVRPGKLVTLPDGRKLNLSCSGRGKPVVVFESGFGAGASAWGKVRPTVARTTQACSYDRAGHGFSDPGPLPRDGASIARDLDQALSAAGVTGPFILVGHSAGGLYARLFAGRRLDDVQGLVLVDPTVERRAPQPEGDGLDGIRRRLRRCLATAETGPPPMPPDSAWAGCLGRAPDPHALQVAGRPETWRGQLSELDNIFGRTSDQVIRMGPLLQAIPAYVITASETAAASHLPGYAEPMSLWTLQHQRLADTFRNGSQRTVFSSHLVMNDRPEVVLDAVLEMLRAAREGRAPEALPPSETLGAIGQDPLLPEAPPGAPSDSAPWSGDLSPR